MARTKFSKLKNIILSKFDKYQIIKNEKLTIIFTVLISIFFSRSQNFYQSIYHNFPYDIQTEIFIRFGQTVILILPVILSAIFLSIKFTRFISGLSLLFSIYLLFRTPLSIDRLENNDYILLISALLTLSALGVCHFSDRAWHRSARIIMIVVLAWGLSPLMLAALQSDQATYRTFTLDRVVRAPPKAVVVLVLDEMSPDLVPLLRPVLTAPDHILHVGYVQKAGKNTINAIPTMLTRRRHDDVAVCGATSLCGDVFFDMARLRASRRDIDVVGFYHPYCAIRGLRSCWLNKPANATLPALFNDMTATMHLVTGGVLPKLKEASEETSSKGMRQVIVEHALNAPFWSAGGGILYVHQFLPHPKGVETDLSLYDEYHANMHQAGRFVSKIKNKLQRNFGKEYLLIVTSDHPLRTSMWCRLPAYASAKCSEENFSEGKNVPFMVLAPQNVPVTVPSTNVGLFSPAP